MPVQKKSGNLLNTPRNCEESCKHQILFDFAAGLPTKKGSMALNMLLDKLKITEKDPDKVIEILKFFPLEKLMPPLEELGKVKTVFLYGIILCSIYLVFSKLKPFANI